MLISTISGTRGTIGGVMGENLTPIDVVSFVSAYGTWLKNKYDTVTVVIGRDARISGDMIMQLTVATLQGLGINTIDLGMVPTPTVGIAVRHHRAEGGIIITASHNPKEYNGIKMLNEQGEFLNGDNGQEILNLVKESAYEYADVNHIGSYSVDENAIERHVEQVLGFDVVDSEAIRAKKFKVVVDGINSVGGIAVPKLLEALGVECFKLYCEPNGEFAHVPEPLEQNLGDLKQTVIDKQADFGIAVDPDVDRLVLVSETGEMVGEEYTLAIVADYILSKTPGSVVSNLSSSRVVRDIAESSRLDYYASKVGEINVVEKMKEVDAVIGGEGNGGVIYPPHHYGRDALIGIALVLSYLTESDKKLSELRGKYTSYFMAKEKIALDDREQISHILKSLEEKYQNEKCTTIDGLKIDFPDSWVHVRASNTEPILRIYTEAKSQEEADALANRFMSEIRILP